MWGGGPLIRRRRKAPSSRRWQGDLKAVAAAVIDDVRGYDIWFCSYHSFIIYGRAPLICLWLNLAYVHMTYESVQKLMAVCQSSPTATNAPRD